MKPVTEHSSSWLCRLGAQELVVIMSAKWGTPAGAKHSSILQGGASLGDSVTWALGILLQELILCKEMAPQTFTVETLPAFSCGSLQKSQPKASNSISQDYWTLSLRNLEAGKQRGWGGTRMFGFPLGLCPACVSQFTWPPSVFSRI